jgi:hypothetical protein
MWLYLTQENVEFGFGDLNFSVLGWDICNAWKEFRVFVDVGWVLFPFCFQVVRAKLEQGLILGTQK